MLHVLVLLITQNKRLYRNITIGLLVVILCLHTRKKEHQSYIFNTCSASNLPSQPCLFAHQRAAILTDSPYTS